MVQLAYGHLIFDVFSLKLFSNVINTVVTLTLSTISLRIKIVCVCLLESLLTSSYDSGNDINGNIMFTTLFAFSTL